MQAHRDCADSPGQKTHLTITENETPTPIARGPKVPHHRGAALRLPRHPNAPDPADLRGVRRWVRAARGRTAVDLFCGAGGLSLGLRDAGFTVLAGADVDELAMETHAANLGCLGYAGDLTDPTEFLEHLEAWGIRSVDLVAGGVPCQPFSRAGQSRIRDLVRSGRRTDDDPRAGLWRSFMTVVETLRPRAVLVENVPDLPSWDDGAVLIGFYESLRALGYHADARILDAYSYGVPQHRARLMLIGLRDTHSLDWPVPHATIPTLRDAIGDLPPVPGGQRLDTIPYRPRHGGGNPAFIARMRAGIDPSERGVIHDHITRAVRPDDMEAFRLLSEGQTYDDLPEHLQRYRSDIFTDKYKRLEWDSLSRTITAHMAKDGYWYIHPEQHRTLSVREAARVQTFPDDFRFAGQPTHRYRQIGNAVPPMLAEAVGLSLVAAIARRTVAPRPADGDVTTREVLRAWHADHARRYPWRAADLAPWHVLMAEICLHRTRADQVVPVFEALLRLAPTPEDMVEHADEALEAMRSLGLRWRAENMIGVARALIADHDGVVPDSELALRSLPGVGDYVAQAVLCFGFGRRAVLMDTNTMRIVGRLRGHADTRRWQQRLDLHRLAGAAGPDAAFNYALLDLGALVCRATKPVCDECPLQHLCVTAEAAGEPDQLTLTRVAA